METKRLVKLILEEQDEARKDQLITKFLLFSGNFFCEIFQRMSDSNFKGNVQQYLESHEEEGQRILDLHGITEDLFKEQSRIRYLLEKDDWDPLLKLFILSITCPIMKDDMHYE